MSQRARIEVPIEEVGALVGLPDDVRLRNVEVNGARDVLILHVTGDRFADVPAGVEAPRHHIEDLRR